MTAVIFGCSYHDCTNVEIFYPITLPLKLRVREPWHWLHMQCFWSDLFSSSRSDLYQVRWILHSWHAAHLSPPLLYVRMRVYEYECLFSIDRIWKKKKKVKCIQLAFLLFWSSMFSFRNLLCLRSNKQNWCFWCGNYCTSIWYRGCLHSLSLSSLFSWERIPGMNRLFDWFLYFFKNFTFAMWK